MDNIRKSVIVLDMIIVIMTGSWVLFGLSQGIDSIELIYNYIYVFVAIISLILNITLIYQHEKIY
ncbi:MAG: hypothetical protein AABX04_07420 [Nanoarchaeota archaeon]